MEASSTILCLNKFRESHISLVEEEEKAVRILQLLTKKPLTYAANVGEIDLGDKGQSNSQVAALRQKAEEENCEVVVVSAQVGVHHEKRNPDRKV